MQTSLAPWYKRFSAQKLIWMLVATIVVLLSLLSFLSPQFDYLLAFLERPTYLAVGIMIAAGMCYLWLVYKITNSYRPIALLPLFLAGILCRLLFINSTPIHEDDFYRYFFDASLTTHGLNPYKFAPQDALDRLVPSLDPELGEVNKLVPAHTDLDFLQHEPDIKRVAYPHVRTIYPVVAQLTFAASYQIKAFNLPVWRAMLMVIEIIGFFILCRLLQQNKKPLSWSAIYWLNPLLITETANAAHMDVLLVPLLLATIFWAKQKRFTVAGIFLALAVGTKIWPLMLIPILFRPLFFQPKQCLLAAIPCLLLSGCLLLPQLANNMDPQAGLISYSQNWRTNSFIFGVVEDSLISIQQTGLPFFGEPEKIARYLVAGIMGWLLLVLVRNPWQSFEQLNWQCLCCISWLFLLSPTGYPWYLIWFLPFLAMRPYMPLLLLTALLPLYDLRYPMQQANMTELFNSLIIPLQFLPVFLLMAVKWAKEHPKLQGPVAQSQKSLGLKK